MVFANTTAPTLVRPRTPVAPTMPQLALTLLGPSSAMAQLWAQMRRVAAHVRTLLLTGEAGCGQDAVARLLHELSPHSQRLFVELSAAEIAERLELPGGLSTLPNEAFLYLPDIQLFSPASQQAILHLFQQRRARSLTILASSTEDLRALASVGQFDAALAETLGALTLAVPPLRERREDLPMLLSQMMSANVREAQPGAAIPALPEAFLRTAMDHAWPGNLPELSKCLRWLQEQGTRATYDAADLLQAIEAVKSCAAEEKAPARLVTLDTVVQEHIRSVLRACRGNKLRAAEVLGISRSTLYRMLDAASGSSTSLPLAS